MYVTCKKNSSEPRLDAKICLAKCPYNKECRELLLALDKHDPFKEKR